MPEYSQNTVLYMEGTFDVSNPNSQQLQELVAKAQQIGQLGYTTVILASWHMWQDGQFFYNDTKYQDVLASLTAIVPALKGAGSSVKNVFISVGGWGSGPDYDHIAENLATFKAGVAQLQTTTGIDGIDWDPEPKNFDYTPYTSLLVELTLWANSMGLLITAAPYMAHEFWVDVLQQVNTPSSAGFIWWNLQNGAGNYPNWIAYVQPLVTNPQSFLVPGWIVDPANATPNDLASSLWGLKQTYAGLDGAFIWQYELAQKNFSAAQYLGAIRTGLEGPTVQPGTSA